MGNLNVKLHHLLDQFSTDEKRILLVGASLYIHYALAAVVVLWIIIAMLREKRLLTIIKQVPRSRFALVFCIITTIVAALYENWIGVACGIGLLLVFLYIFYYRTVITKPCFELLLDICIVCSMFFVVWGCIEYYLICQRLDHSVFELFIANSPKNRVHVGSFNANYYAMIIEFTVLLCFYKALQWKSVKHTLWYGFAVIANLFMLVLTGCRTAWVPFVVSVPLLILFFGMYKLFALSLVSIGGVGGFVLMNPELMKRAAYITKDFAKRERIWTTAIQGIKAHPLFGEGPMTYLQIYPLYNGHPTNHSHSVYLDPILSHGIIPVLVVAVYFFSNLKEVIKLFTQKIDVPLFGLMVGFLVTVLLHGMLDYTVYWIQTGILFLMVMSASSMYFQDGYNKGKRKI